MRTKNLARFAPGVGWVLAVYVVWRLAIQVIAVLAELNLAPDPIGPDRAVRTGWDSWGQWDATYYFWIATDGYPEEHLPVFFPAFPLLIRSLNWLFSLPSQESGLLVNLLITPMALLAMFFLSKRLSDDKTAKRSVLYLLLFPTAVFLAAPYTESLYLLFAIGAFLAAEKDRWWAAGILGALASATRLTGVFLLPVLLLLYLEKRQWKFREVGLGWLWLFIIPLGLGAYALWLTFEGWGVLSFLDAGATQWPERALSFNVVETIGDGLGAAFSGRSDGVRGVFTPIVDVLAIAFALGGLILMWTRLRKAYFAYTALILATVLATTVTTSANRYVLGMFPLFIVLGMVGKREAIDRIYVLLGGMGLGLFTAMYVTGYWVG